MLKKENGGKGEKNKLQKKRKRSTSKDQGSSDDEYRKNDKTSGRKNKLKRKKEELEKAEALGKTNSETRTDTAGSLGNLMERTERQSETAAEGNNGDIIDVDTEPKNEGRTVQMETMEGMGNDSEKESRGMDEEVEGMADENDAGVEVRKDGCSQEREEEQGATVTLEGKKQIDIEKCRTKDKSKEKSCRRSKLRKKVKESGSQETVNKSLNLSDVCANMVDGSVISDGEVNTSQVKVDSGDTEEEIVKENNENETSKQGFVDVSNNVYLDKEVHTENAVRKVTNDKLENSGEVEEESYEHFLLMHNCGSKTMDMVGKEDVCEQMEENLAAKDKMQKGTSKETRENQQTSGSIHSNKAVKKKSGRQPKKAEGLHSTSNSISHSVEIAVSDEGKDGDEKGSVKEVSYADYLITIGEDKSEGNMKAKRSINDLLGKGVESMDSQARDVGLGKSCEDDGADIPMPKQYPSITNFFTKVNRNEISQDTKAKTKSDHMTIKAVVHEQNCQNAKGKEGKSDKKNGVKKLQLSKHKSEDTIQVLSSEIIVIEDKDMDVNCHRSEKCVSQDLTEETELEADDVIDIAEDEKVKKNLFLHSVTAPEKSVKQKMSQATIKFTNKGLQMKKTERDRVEKPLEETCESTTEPNKRKRGRRKGVCKTGNVSTAQLNTTQSNPDSSRTFDDESMEEDFKGSCESLAERRKSLRLKYKVKLVQNTEDGSPIRMKFMRYGRGV